MRFKILITLMSIIHFSNNGFAESYLDLLNQSETEINELSENNKRWRRDSIIRDQEKLNRRDKSDDVCSQLPAGSDAQIACFGDYILSIRDERARNIMLGNCLALGSAELSADLSYICEKGKNACSILKDGDAGFYCKKCGATKRWLAVYSLGYTIRCF